MKAINLGKRKAWFQIEYAKTKAIFDYIGQKEPTTAKCAQFDCFPAQDGNFFSGDYALMEIEGIRFLFLMNKLPVGYHVYACWSLKRGQFVEEDKRVKNFYRVTNKK